MTGRDAEKLAALWTKAQPTVAGFIRAMIQDEDQAAEVLQETAVVCVRKFDSYDAARPFDAWAVGIARLQVFAWRRAATKQQHVLDDDLVARIADSYERMAERAEGRREALRACLENTRGRGRLALRLQYGQGMKTDEIGAEMDMTGGAARTLLSRTRVSLRKCIERRLARQESAT
jgi:RNA polymerase sigma-70 factor (ECF subfamily)